MNFTDEPIIIKQDKKNIQTGPCDIFDPSIYVPDKDKYRENFVKSLSAKIADVVATLDNDGGDPTVDVVLKGDPTDRVIELRFHNLKGDSGESADVAALVSSIEELQSTMSQKATHDEFEALKTLVYSMHSSGGHSYSPTVFFKNSKPTLNIEYKIKVGNSYVDITSTEPKFIKGTKEYKFNKDATSTNTIHKYNFIDVDGVLDNSIVVDYVYKSLMGPSYSGTIQFKGVSVVYYGKSPIEELTQTTAQELINKMYKLNTPVSSAATTSDIYNIRIYEDEVSDPTKAPFFYFAIPEDVEACSKFYTKGGSPQFAADLVSQGAYEVNVNDACGSRKVIYRFYRCGARQGAGTYTLYTLK